MSSKAYVNDIKNLSKWIILVVIEEISPPSSIIETFAVKILFCI